MKTFGAEGKKEFVFERLVFSVLRIASIRESACHASGGLLSCSAKKVTKERGGGISRRARREGFLGAKFSVLTTFR